MTKFEGIPRNQKFAAVAASVAIAVAGGKIADANGSSESFEFLRPSSECLDAAVGFPDYLGTKARETANGDAVFIGKVSVGAVTDNQGNLCPDKNGERNARLIMKINGDPVDQPIVGFMGNRVEDTAKLRIFPSKQDCRGQKPVEAQAVYKVKVKTDEKTIREKYLSPVASANC